MNTTPILTSRRSGWRSRLGFTGLPAALALITLAVTTARANVVFTRNTQTAEPWAHYTATFTPAFSGPYTLGFNLTAGGPSGDNAILIDRVKVAQGATIVFEDGFESPGLDPHTSSSSSPGNTLTIGNWAFTNFGGILDGSPPNWGLAEQGLGTADGTTQYGYIQAAHGSLGKVKAGNTLNLIGGQTYTISFYQATRRDFGGITTYTVTLDSAAPSVYASGLSPIIAWDPIFPAGPVNPDSAEATPVPSVGYSDPRWTNPHAASVFPKNSHVWEHQSWVPAAFKFDAHWINAWPNLDSNGHGKTSPGWSGAPNQSWTKYSTTVYGGGSHVLQFLADNASWIYLDGALVGYQDWNWANNGSGRYTINLTGVGPHELSFIIWDGGGLAGGKFRLETTQSFLANNPGATLPPAPAGVALSNLSHTYDGAPKSATVTTSPSGLTTTVTYNGSTTPPTNVGSYSVIATVTSAGYLGSATGTLTIGKATATVTLGNLAHTYDGTMKSATATTSPAGLNVAINYSGGRVNAGSYGVQALVDNPNYTGSTTGSLVIAKANATVNVTGYTGTYDAAAHGASGTATGVGGVNLGGSLNFGATFTDAPGGTAHWTFTGGTNYNDQSGDVAIVINKANATVNVTGYTGTYDAAAHGASGTATGVGGVNLGGSLNLGATFTDAPGGTAHWTFTGGTNYIDQSGSVAIAINKANATVKVSGYTGVYDGAPHGATGSATGVGGVDLSAGLNLGAAFTNAPGGTASWTFSGGTNYNNASGSAAIVINKANATVVVTPYEVEYDGQPHSATVASIIGVNGESGATVGAVSLNTTHTGVGIYSDTWSFTGTTNYNNIGATPITNVIKDTTAPTITSLSTNAPTLWPPNHKMVAVTVKATATDLVGVTSLKISTVTSNEPDNGLGDGDTAHDIQVTGDLTVNLRAERGGGGNGRVYTITVEARDRAGNVSTRTVSVSVPKSQGGK